MDIILYSLILLAGVAFIAYPLFVGRQQQLPQESSQAKHREGLLKEKQAVYAAIKDLDFEYKTGKLSDEDYAALRESYRARALNLLQQINEPEEEAASAASVNVDPVETSSSLEQKSPPASTDTVVSAEIETLHCVKCGQVNPQGSKFCGTCGMPMESAPTCGKCGAIRDLDDRFCHVCGNPLNLSTENCEEKR